MFEQSKSAQRREKSKVKGTLFLAYCGAAPTGADVRHLKVAVGETIEYWVGIDSVDMRSRSAKSVYIDR